MATNGPRISRPLLALLAAALLLASTVTISQARTSSCTPNITQAQMNAWAADYQASVNASTPAMAAFNFWFADAGAREVPQLACLSRAQMAEVYNLQNISIWKDGASNFKNQAGTLNFTNDLVATGGSAYLGTPAKVYYYTGSGLTVGTWTG